MSDRATPQELPTVRDFPDRLPPMVVKELRQGLRAKLFGETISGFHLVLVIILLPSLTFSRASEITSIQRLLWWIISAVLLVILPLRGLSALIQERRENTLDTLLLTNLSAGRIVWGKWLAICSQISLAGFFFVPYAIVAYAAGGVSLPESLSLLMRLALLGASLAATYVAVSWNSSWIARVGPALFFSWLALTQCAGPMIRSLLTGNSSFPAASAMGLLAEIIAAGSLIYWVLKITSDRLAPWREDHRTGPKLLAGILPLLLAIGATHDDWSNVLSHVSLVGLTLVSVTSLTEPWPGPARPTFSPLLGEKRPWRGLSSGWPYGVAWALMAWGIMLGVTQWWVPTQQTNTLRLIAWLFTGRLLLFLLPAKKRNHAPTLLATALVFFLVQTALSLASELLRLPFLTTVANAVPGVLPVPGLDDTKLELSWVAASTAGTCALVALLEWWRHRPNRKLTAP